MISVTFPVHIETSAGEETWQVTMETAWRHWSFVGASRDGGNMGSRHDFESLCQIYGEAPDLEGLAADAYASERGDDDTIRDMTLDAHAERINAMREEARR